MRKLFAIVFASFVTGIAGFWGGSHLFSQNVRLTGAGVVTPFVAHLEKRGQSSVGALDTQQHVTTILYARRVDRSYVRVISSDGSSRALREIADVPSHQMVTLDPITKSKITYQYSATGFYRLLNTMDSENCPSTPEGAPDIERTAKFSRRVVHVGASEAALDQAQKVQEESWKIPDLACFPVKQIATRSDGARIDIEVTSLTEGTPPAELFEIPDDYQERSPLAVEHLYQREFQHAFFGETAAMSLDKTYLRLKALNSNAN